MRWGLGKMGAVHQAQTHTHTDLAVVGVVEEAEGAAAVAGHEERGLLVGLPQVLVQQELGGAVVVDKVPRPVRFRVHARGEVPLALRACVYRSVWVSKVSAGDLAS